MIPENCRRSVHRIAYAMNVTEDAAYAMLIMTALLMDLYPEDEDVVRMILTDHVPEIA